MVLFLLLIRAAELQAAKLELETKAGGLAAEVTGLECIKSELEAEISQLQEGLSNRSAALEQQLNKLQASRDKLSKVRWCEACSCPIQAVSGLLEMTTLGVLPERSNPCKQ